MAAWTENVLVWRVWSFDVDDPNGYETAARLQLEPFAVSDGKMYWKGQYEEPHTFGEDD